MKIKSNIAKFTTAAALAITGIAAVNAVNANSMTSNVAAATNKVTVNYVPGYGINIWNSYENPTFTGQRVQHGTVVNVIDSETDAKGNVWYEIGPDQWIQAQYTVKGSVAAKHVATSTKQAKKVVKLAKAEVGKAYVWGGTSPSGFDCSGLVQYVYNQAIGKDLTRTTYTQVKQGKEVSMQDLKPGDLLFWGSADSPYHVGIYIGNNQFIHAATPEQGVIKATLSSYFYPSVAKRVLN
ncbi:C40 family peptidase [Lactobacillus sp. ESL0731]|uniref:C40 family peptidase n=1 Tax=unclassified Lactobacillus TaxID=2620435 RepID=UPI0023F79D37|nr:MULTISPECIES: C40 family peptidase [unclassified Lactobacillus]WEV50890.1 C40 family peptidase [Lactobacillus sp. ESL0700]WEV62021.1 C40 family peptidase [Lactobacillus sp. ESL0731]